MPLYEFSCPEHGRFDEFQDMHEMHRAVCPKCGKRADRVFSPAAVTVDFRPGFDPGIGKYVETKHQRENYMRMYGLRRIKS